MKGELLFQIFSVCHVYSDDIPGMYSSTVVLSKRECELCGKWWKDYDESRSSLMVPPEIRRWPVMWPDFKWARIVHERVVEVMLREGLTGFRAHRLPWFYMGSPDDLGIKPIKGEDLPTYCVLEITGRVDANLYEMDNEEVSTCAGCGRRTFRKGKSYPQAKRIVPVDGTWDGSDICMWRNYGVSEWLCSRRLIDLAAEHQWTNVVFGSPCPGFRLESPVPKNWLEIVTPKIAERHADLL
jgi:hypothetical protein